MKTALVTGASGLIGSWLAERLAEEGFAVRCLVRQTSSLQWLEGRRVSLVNGDLCRDEIPGEALRGVTHVFHCAGVLRALRSRDFFEANEQGTRRLLAACVPHADSLQRFVLISSLAAAGPGTAWRPVREDDDPAPVSVYGRSKLAAERAVLEHAHRLPVTIVRPPAVYGPRERDLLPIYRQVRRRVRLSVGFRDRCLSLIHVHDLVDGIIATGTHANAVGRTYFLANDDAAAWSTFVRAVAVALGRRTVPIALPGWAAYLAAAPAELHARITGRPAVLNFDKVREISQGDWVCSTARVREEIGFRPALSLEEGVRRTVEWYVQHRWL